MRRLDELQAYKDGSRRNNLTRSLSWLISLGLFLGGSLCQTSLVLAQPAEQNDRYAVIIGVENYNDRTIPALQGVNEDATAIKDALVRYAGFPQDHIEFLTSDQAGENRPTKEQILRRLVALTRQVTAHGFLLLAFAGHGIELDGQGFLLPQDAVLAESADLLRETAIPIATLKKLLQQGAEKRVLVMLDVCRERPTESQEKTSVVLAEHCLTSRSSSELRFTELDSGVEAFSLLYATGLGMQSYTSPTSDRGYLATALVDGLKGQAANAEGSVTLDSLLRYLQKTVPETVRNELGKSQQPWVERGGVDLGDFVLVRVAGNVPQRIVITMPKAGGGAVPKAPPAPPAAPAQASSPPPPPQVGQAKQSEQAEQNESGQVRITPPRERFTLYAHLSRIFAIEVETPGFVEPELRYEWSLDDNLVSTEEIFELKNQPPGVHTVEVTVRTPSGARTTQTWTVEIRKKEEGDPDVPSERWPAEVSAQLDDIVTDVTKKEPITLSGSVRNVGKREVDSLAIWVTAVDENDRPLSRRMLLVPQPQPLQPGQNARFSVRMANRSGNTRFIAQPICR